MRTHSLQSLLRTHSLQSLKIFVRDEWWEVGLLLVPSCCKLWALLNELFHISTVQVSLLYTKPT